MRWPSNGSLKRPSWEEELFKLKNWKVVTEQKLKLAERARDEYHKMTEELKKVLEDKEIDLLG